MNFLRSIHKRTVSYALTGMFVIGVNGNVLATPVMDQVDHYMSHRKSVAAEYGQWDVMKTDSPVNSIHAALLHTGKVLLIAGSGNNAENFDNKSFRSVLWDPKDGSFTEVPTPWDAFCSGHAFLPDGRLLVAGGTKKYEDLTLTPKQEFEGLKDSYIFDPVTERYQKVSDMEYARWYPTLVGLANGSILSASGLDENGKIIYGHTEIFDPVEEKWKFQPQLNRLFPTYPTLMLMEDGRLFFTGASAGYGSATEGRTPGLWDLSNNTFQNVPGLGPEMLETAASVMLPPAQDQKVMVLGGGGIGDSQIATDRTAIVDLKEPNPAYKLGPSLYETVRYPSAVILPDDTVLTTGGSTNYRDNDVLKAAIYHPNTNSFKKAASPFVGRNYHSEALLLPDGRVATFGSNPIDNSFELRVEVYSPAYLFKDYRPRITSAPAVINHNTIVEVGYNSLHPITSAKLMRPSAVTHVTDVEQRSVNLPITHTNKGVEVAIPENKNLIPGGWYMLFLTDSKGVPTEARWIHLK
jgi:hypothetical protein